MVVGAYDPELAGGSLQCRTLVHALGDRVRFSVLTTTADRALPERAEVDGVPVYRVFVDARAAASKLAALMSLIRLMPSLAGRHDLFHFHGFTEKMLVLLAAAKLSGRPTIEKMTSVGWDDPVAIRSRPFGRALAAGMAHVDRLVAVSPAMRDRCRAAGVPDRLISNIPNGVDVARFAPADAGVRAELRRRLGLPADVPLVSFVGFWSGEKGPDVLFDAWLEAQRRTGMDAALLYIGATRATHGEVDPSLVGAVRQRAEAGGLGGRVIFVEQTQDMATYLQASDIFALPSSREGLSNALLEAMSTGLPCVTGAIPGVSDSAIDSEVNGFIVPAGDRTALAAVIARLMQSVPLREDIGRRARDTVLEKFAIGTVAARYLSLYSEVLDR